MTLTLLSPKAFEVHFTAHHGVPPSRAPEAVAEVLRAELFALGTTYRWVLESRVHALLGRLGITKEDVAEARRTLESVGDLVAGPGGEVARAPLRGVFLGPGRWMIVGSLPTGEAREGLGVSPSGLPRRISVDSDERVKAWIVEMGGRVLDVARWSGLEHVISRGRFLEDLEARIEAASRFADRASAFALEELQVFAPGIGQTNPEKAWKSAPLAEASALVRARQAGGWRAYAWARQVQDKREIVPLSGDEARRAMFAKADEVGAPFCLPTTRAGSIVELALPVLLPAAEYRWLAAMGEMQSEPRRVRLDEPTFQKARAMLAESLGVVVGEVP